MGETTVINNELNVKCKSNAFETEEYYYILYKIKSDNIPTTNKKTIIDDDDISNDSFYEVMFTNITPEDQKGLNLIKFIKEKMERNLIFETGSLCILPTLISKNKVSRTISCFLSLINVHSNTTHEKETSKYILCLVTTMDNDSFSLFRDDIEKYVKKLGNMMSDFDNNELNLKKIEEYLSSWKSISIDYIVRSTELLDNNIDVFLHSCLMGKQIQINTRNPYDEDSIKRFSELISLTNVDLLLDSEDENQEHHDIETLEINISEENVVTLNSSETNDFCKNWAALLLNNKSNSVKLRHIIDQLKLKLNQDLNQIKRLVDSAIYDCYGLYEAFEYIKRSPCKDVLLVCLLKDHFNNDEAKNVLEVIYNFLLEIGEVNS